MAGQLPYTSIKKSSQALGFTIVELLIVIVVIGILAAITIVSFNGISNRAKVAMVVSDLNAVSKKLKADQATTSSYPASLAATDGGKGVPASAGTTYQYTVDNSANPPTFCVTAVNGSTAYFITQSGVPSAGTCPGDSSGGVSPPVIANYYDFTTYVDGANKNLTNVPMPSIVDGSWMIIVVAYTNGADAVAPSGWTTLYTRTTAGSLQTMAFGKIKTSSDPSTFSITGLGGTTANGVIAWGTGASSNIGSWVKSAIASRDGTSAQQYTTTTPTVTTTVPQTLVLSVSTERTTATETDIGSLTGATKWFFGPQDGSSKLQTITMSYATLSTIGTSTPVTITYPNAQTLNGSAFQIALPPS